MCRYGWVFLLLGHPVVQDLHAAYVLTAQDLLAAYVLTVEDLHAKYIFKQF